MHGLLLPLQRMEDMANEFGEMLKETLEKMRDRIEVTNQQFSEKDTGARIIRKLEDASMHVGEE